jgi:hypothetical protein
MIFPRTRHLAMAILLAPAVPAMAANVWDLKELPPETMAVYFRSMEGGQLGVPIDTGDFNGDGHRDVAASPFNSSTKDRNRNGVVYVILGNGTIAGEIDTGNHAGPMLEIHGAEDYSLLGVEIVCADMDNDGLDDVILGSSHGRFNDIAATAGEVVILFGNENWGDSVRELDMRNLPESQRAKFFLGERSGDRLGGWFDAADIDGNGRRELLLGMDMSDGPNQSRPNAGAAAIVWDAAFAYPDAPFLRVGDVATSDAITLIYGRDAGDQLGATNLLGDVDGDGGIDAVVSAGVTRSGLQISALGYSGSGGGDGPNNLRPNAGETTILWDAARLRGIRTIDLLNPPVGLEHTIVYGESDRDYFGEELYLATFTGDGDPDLIIGAILGGKTQLNSGAAFIVPKTTELRTMASVDVASPPEEFIVAIDSAQRSAWGGDTVEFADINRDGLDDFFAALPAGTPLSDERFRAGFVPLIFGGQQLPWLPERVVEDMETTPPLDLVVIAGPDLGDLLAYSSAVGDMDGDGVTDYLASAMQGDGYLNQRANAGEFYVVSGDRLARLAAAPPNVTVHVDATNGEPLVLWDEPIAVFGPITSYELLLRDTLARERRVRVKNREVLRSDVAGPATLVSVSTVMDKDGVEELSTPVAVDLFVEGPGTIWILK